MKLHNKSKYLLNSLIIVACCLQQFCWGQSTTVRPYKFGFTIDEQQHRKEQRDERGIVMGEFGFITADGIYHVTVYATDEQGRFRILAMKSYPYESPPKTVEVMVQPKIPTRSATSPKPLTKHNFNTEACSGCFLSNGNNKPKAANDAQEKMTKKNIRPLSKTIPNSNSGANSKLPSKQPATGKITGLNNEFNLLDFPTNKDAIKLNTVPVPKFLIFEDFNVLEHAIKNDQFHTPSTHLPYKLATIPFVNTLYETATTPKPHVSNNLRTLVFENVPYKVITTPSTFIPNKIHATSDTIVPDDNSKMQLKNDFNANNLNFHNKNSVTPSTLTTIKNATTPRTKVPGEVDRKQLTSELYATGIDEIRRPKTSVQYKESTTPLTLVPNKADIVSYTSVPDEDVRTQLTSHLNQDGKRTKTNVHIKDPTTPSTYISNKESITPFSNLPHENVRTQLTSDLNTFSEDKKRTTTSAYYKGPTTTSTLVRDKVSTTSSIINPDKHARTHLTSDLRANSNDEKTLTTNAHIKDPTTPSTSLKTTPTRKTLTNKNFNLKDLESILNEQKISLNAQKQNSSNSTGTPHNAPTNIHQVSVTNNKHKDTSVITQNTPTIDNNPLNFMNTNTFNFLKYDLSLPTNSTAIENKLSKTSFTNSPDRANEPSSNSESRLAESINYSKQPSSLSTQNAQTELNTKSLLHKQNTSNPAVSKDLSQKTPATTKQGSSDTANKSKTATEKTPPIMDIIMQKVLPALMGKTAKTTSTAGTQPTTFNNKSNAVLSGRKTSSSNTAIDGNKKSGSGSVGQKGVSDDGDLYRFKYILDYHGHTETGKRNGNKEGSYFAIGDDNVERTIEYVANEFGYQPRIRWRKLDVNAIKSKQNTLKDYEFVWFN